MVANGPEAAASRADASRTADAPPGPLFERGELLSAVSATVLLLLLTSTAWYGGDLAPGKRSGAARAVSLTGWTALSATRWLLVLLVCVVVGSLLLHVAQRPRRQRTDTSGMIALLATISALWVTYRTLIDLPSPRSIVDVKVGGYLGMLCAYGVAIGGYQYLRAVRLATGAAAPTGPDDPPGAVGAQTTLPESPAPSAAR